MGLWTQWSRGLIRARRRCCPQRWRCWPLGLGLLLLGGCALLLLRTLPEGDHPVTLLIWTHPFGHYQELPDCLQRFGIGECTLTDDPRAYPWADAILIHHRDLVVGEADLPLEPRPRGQKWIWMNYESPTHTRELWRFEGVFNLTLSYRADSDIFLPYGFLTPRAPGAGGVPLSRTSPSARSRRGFVSWVISNWSEQHARVFFYRELREFVRVDVFGGVGRPLARGRAAVVRLLRGYSFYLALENSQHTDYITEKLWNAVAAGAIPVVLGPPRRNYERFLPPEAFIHVDDFPTVRQLAKYLVMLRRNPARMRRHLDWRGGYNLQQPLFWDEHYCTACRAVGRRGGRTGERVKDLTGWFFS